MSVNDLATQASLSYLQYKFSVEESVFRKDGFQSMVVNGIASNRLSYLAAQVNLVAPSLNHYGVIYIPLVVGAVGAIAKPLAAHLTKKHPDSRAVKNLCKVLEGFTKTSEWISKHVHKVVDVACLVSYVAFIYMGFPVAGCIGLAGLALILLKKSGHLPSVLDRYSDDIAFIANVVVVLNAPIAIVWKIVQGLLIANHLTYFFSRHPRVEALLPKWLTDPMYNFHEINPNRSPEKFAPRDLRELIEEKSLNFNWSSIHAKPLNHLFPEDLLAKADKWKAAELFEAIEAQMEKGNLSFTDDEAKGWELLRNGVIRQIFTDKMPPCIEKFVVLMKMQMVAILEDEKDFEAKVRELAAIGNNCSEGWPREVGFLVNPRSKEVAWTIHHQLAKFRGDLLQNAVCSDRDIKHFLDLAGGSNNTHVMNAIHAATWHLFRTYPGEIHRQVEGKSIVGQLIKKFMAKLGVKSLREDSIAGGVQAGFIALNVMLHNRTLKPLAFYMYIKISETLRDYKAYGESGFLERIYNSIKPDYQWVTENGETKEIQTREIPWETINSWLTDVSKRVPSFKYYRDPFQDDEEPLVEADPNEYGENGYNPYWIETDLHGKQTLTKEAVALLLWDLGILEASSDAAIAA